MLYKACKHCAYIINYVRIHRRQRTEYFILTSAKLISPVIEASFAPGFDW